MTPGRHITGQFVAFVIVAFFAAVVLGWLLVYLVRTDGGRTRPADMTPTPIIVTTTPVVAATTPNIATPTVEPTEALPRAERTRVPTLPPTPTTVPPSATPTKKPPEEMRQRG